MEEFPCLLSTCLLLDYRKVTTFCKWILYPATILKALIISRSFQAEFLEPLMYAYYDQQIRNALARALSTILKRVGRMGYVYLFCILFVPQMDVWNYQPFHLYRPPSKYFDFT